MLALLRKSLLPRQSGVYFTHRLQARQVSLLSGRAFSTWDSPVGNQVIATSKKDEKPNTPEDDWNEHSRDVQSKLFARTPVDAYAGRTVYIKDGNVAEGYAVLQGILQRNKVRSELRRQERHEKKGEKRRRLSSERWRIRFAHEVRTKVQLVQKIRDRGA